MNCSRRLLAFCELARESLWTFIHGFYAHLSVSNFMLLELCLKYKEPGWPRNHLLTYLLGVS